MAARLHLVATGADPIGDDQTTRSGWGGLDECAVEGAQPAIDYRAVVAESRMEWPWLPLVAALLFVAASVASIFWPLGVAS
jgi:hypothetical protein